MAEDLMSVLGHELRSPLTAIRGAATLLLMSHSELPPGKVEELLQVIDDQAAAMAARVEDVLVSARLGAGTLELFLEALDLEEVLEDLRESGAARGRRLSVRLPPDGLPVRADHQRLIQVLRALLDNATRFSPPGSAIEVRAVAVDGKARVEVRDRGPGVSEADRVRVFERGVKLEPSGPGAGLGLYVAAGLIRAMGGEEGVAARSGGGSVFWFTLPLAK